MRTLPVHMKVLTGLESAILFFTSNGQFPAIGADPIIVSLPELPEVKLILAIQPADALDVARVDMMSADDHLVEGIPFPLDPHPHRIAIRAGHYRISARIENSDRFAPVPGQYLRIMHPATTN